MIAQRPDKHGIVRLWYRRPPQAFIDWRKVGKYKPSAMFLGCRLTEKGHLASVRSYLAWLDKRDEWAPQ